MLTVNRLSGLNATCFIFVSAINRQFAARQNIYVVSTTAIIACNLIKNENVRQLTPITANTLLEEQHTVYVRHHHYLAEFRVTANQK